MLTAHFSVISSNSGSISSNVDSISTKSVFVIATCSTSRRACFLFLKSLDIFGHFWLVTQFKTWPLGLNLESQHLKKHCKGINPCKYNFLPSVSFSCLKTIVKGGLVGICIHHKLHVWDIIIQRTETACTCWLVWWAPAQPPFSSCQWSGWLCPEPDSYSPPAGWTLWEAARPSHSYSCSPAAPVAWEPIADCKAYCNTIPGAWWMLFNKAYVLVTLLRL